MLNKILDDKALKQYKNEEFKLEIYKSKGSDKPGFKYKGSQHGLLIAYEQLVETAIKEDVIPVVIMHDLLLTTAKEYGKAAHKDESK